MLNTKSRLTYIPKTPCPERIPINKWTHLQEIYKNPNCHLCPDKLHNHEHLLSTCPLTIAIHDSMLNQMASYLRKSCSNFTGIRPWFSTSAANSLENPVLKHGDKGLIPSSFIPSIRRQKPSSQDVIKKLLTIFQTYMVAKWKLHTHVNLNTVNSIDQVKSNLRLLRAIEISL